MPLLLRKVQRSHWLSPGDWRFPGDPWADALRSLMTQQAALSLWEVSDDLANLDQVICALASACDHLAVVDYCAVPRDALQQLGVTLQAEAGETPCLPANRWHVNAGEITARQLGAFAHMIQNSGLWGRYTKSQVRSVLSRANENHELDASQVNPSLMNAITAK